MPIGVFNLERWGSTWGIVPDPKYKPPDLLREGGAPVPALQNQTSKLPTTEQDGQDAQGGKKTRINLTEVS